MHFPYDTEKRKKKQNEHRNPSFRNGACIRSGNCDIYAADVTVHRDSRSKAFRNSIHSRYESKILFSFVTELFSIFQPTSRYVAFLSAWLRRCLKRTASSFFLCCILPRAPPAHMSATSHDTALPRVLCDDDHKITTVPRFQEYECLRTLTLADLKSIWSERGRHWNSYLYEFMVTISTSWADCV